MYIDPDSLTSSHLFLVSTPSCTDSNIISFLPGLRVLLVPHVPPCVQVVRQCRLPLAIGRQEVKEGTISANHISPLDIMPFISLAYIAISIDASGVILLVYTLWA